MEHFIEFLIFGFTVFIAMNQLFDIALLFQGSGSYAFYGIPVLADNTNQVGERFLIYTNRIDKVDTAVDDSDLIAGCNIQSTHLLYNSVVAMSKTPHTQYLCMFARHGNFFYHSKFIVTTSSKWYN